jgi:hypothetical protein
MQSMKSGSFESLQSAKSLERLSKKGSNNQATDQSGTVDFSFFQKESSCDKSAAVIARLCVFNLQAEAPDDVIKLFVYHPCLGRL